MFEDVRSIDKGVSFSSLLDTLDPSSRERAEKYRFMDDQKRSTLSSLLQKAAVANMYSLNSSEYSILRTREVCPIPLIEF